MWISNLRTAWMKRWEKYDGFIFSWGGDGLEPARKKWLVHRQLAQAVSLEVLIDELKSGRLRKTKMPNVSCLKEECELKFSNC